MSSRSVGSALSALGRTPVPLIIACAPWLVMLGWLAAVSWFLSDDAFISFRYARNLLDGHGLVFNVGERVEGYSNFLWTIELAGIWRAFGIPPEDAAPWLSVAFTVATLAAMAWWIARLPNLRRRRLVMWMSLGLVCSSATFAVWTSGGGLETRQFTFFIVLAVVLLTTCRNSRGGLLAASVSLALASLTRPEGPMIAMSCFAWYILQSILSPRSPSTVPWKAGIQSVVGRIAWRDLLCLIAPFAVIVCAHFLFRYAYYGELLPNTYYAKYVRTWYDMGILYLAAAVLDTGLYLLLPLAGVGVWDRWRANRGDVAFVLPLLCIVPHMQYLAQIGGDTFEYRPMDFYWPLLAVPASVGIVRLGGAIAGRAQRMRSFAWGRRVIASTSACALLLFVPVVVYANGMQGVLLYRGATAPESLLISSNEFDASSIGWLLSAPGIPVLAEASNVLRSSLSKHTIALPVIRRNRWFANDQLEKYRPYERAWRGVLPDDAVMATKAVGVVPYYLPDLTFVDNYGLTDKTVARSPFTRVGARRLAHERIPPPGYLEERGVNFTIYPPQPSADDALARASYAVQVGPDLWMPFDTHDHQWAYTRFAQHGLQTRSIDLNALVGDRQPIIRSRYNVYRIENALIYVNERCDSVYDLAATFFLHLLPADARDLPPERAEYGFDNLDFIFQERGGSSVGGICVVSRQLPEYEIAGIRTGQYLFGYASDDTEVWEAEFRYDGQGE